MNSNNLSQDSKRCHELLVMYDDPIMRKFAKLELSKPGDCGYDLYNASREFIFIPPGHTVEVPTGIRVKIPDGHAGFIKGRSSTFYRRKLLVIEGIIDSGYTGQLFVNVWNPAFDEDNKPTIIEPMERLGQIVIVTIPTLDVVVVDKLPVTERGDSGFGSTGL